MGIQVVSFNCVLKNTLGTLISSTFNHDVLTYSPKPGNMLVALAEGLQDLRQGEKRKIEISAGEAYGFYDPKKVFVRSREEIQRADLKMGDQVLITTESGQSNLLRVTEIDGEHVTLDGNHELAGQDLVFEIETISAREATPEEIAESIEVVEPVLLH